MLFAVGLWGDEKITQIEYFCMYLSLLFKCTSYADQRNASSLDREYCFEV
jgi:hypothetical protein